MALARKAHPRVVADCIYRGVLGHERDGLAVYSMSRLPGTQLVVARDAVQVTLFRHYTFVCSLARFFAESLQTTTTDKVMLEDVADECAMLIDSLEGRMPPEFQGHASYLRRLESERNFVQKVRYGEFPVVLTHGDLSPENILVDPASGAITGVVGWGSARYLPFGFALYAMRDAIIRTGHHKSIGGWWEQEGRNRAYRKILEQEFWRFFIS